MSFDFGSDDVLLDISAICKKLGISRSTLDRLRNKGTMAQQAMTALRHNKKNTELMGSFGPQWDQSEDSPEDMPPFPEPTVMLGRAPRWSASVLNEWLNQGNTSR